jgi:hypothetical protein
LQTSPNKGRDITLWYFTLLEDPLLGSDLFRYYIYVTYSINK